MDWYRAYHGMPQDTKLKVVAHRTKQPMASVLAVWVYLLDMASQSNPRGNVVIDAEQIAVLQDLETADVTKIINAFYEKNLLTPENRLTAWDKRQYTSSTERSKKFRAGGKRNATSRNTVQRDATPGNAAQRKNREIKTDRDTDNRTELEADEDEEKDLEKNKDKKLRTRAEKREREREKHQNCSAETLEQLLQIWNAEVQSKITKSHKAILTTQRKELLCKRWIEDFQQDIRAWRYYCEIIGNSEFCLGKVAGKGWTIDLSWAIESSEHVAKILEGGFSGGNHPPKAPACNVPEVQQAWDAVLHAFQLKYGAATCRSWLSNTVITRSQWICDGRVVTLLCPSKFSREWLNIHYLADLIRWFADITKNDARVTGVELITEA